MTTLTCDGVALAYTDFPAPSDTSCSAPALVLHGFTGAGAAMAPLVERLNIERRVLTVDLVGHGESDSPEDQNSYTIPAMARQLRALIKQLDLSPVHLIGYSLGGRIALSLAADDTDLLAGLTLIGVSAGLADPEQRRKRRRQDNLLADDIHNEGLSEFIDRWMDLEMWKSLRTRIGEDAWQASREQRLSNQAHGLAQSLRGSGTGVMPPLKGQLHTIGVPTLLVVGSEDQKFLAIADELAAEMTKARIAKIHQAGHAAHLEQPDATCVAINEHLKRCD
jgi:2-succinyl-6-hydroxy-2,4-cyclohexadiene-1-carboxylate synthase